MNNTQTRQFFADRDAALQDGSVGIVRAFLTKYNIPGPASDSELAQNIAYCRVTYGISLGGDYWKDAITLQLNGHRQAIQ